MSKKRAEWTVRLYPSNLDGVKGTVVRIVQRGNITLDQLANLLEERTGIYRADSTRAVINLMTDLVEEMLDALEGKPHRCDYDGLTPVFHDSGRYCAAPVTHKVTLGEIADLWDFDRIQPTARAKNKAKVRFKPGKRLKKALEAPLFHETAPRSQGPSFNPVDRFPINDKWEYVMKPDAVIFLEGRRLLMNGDDPACGFYILDAASGEVRRFFPREEILLNTRGQLMVKLNGELPPGLYRFRVVSQCTTNSTPLRKPLTGDSKVPYRIYPPGEEYVIIKEGKKI